MYVSRYSFFTLVFILGACSSSPGYPLGSDAAARSAASRGTPDLIVRAELEELSSESMMMALQKLRPRWLRPVRTRALDRIPSLPQIIVDQTSRRDFEALHGIFINDVETLRYLSPASATTRYGTGFPGGLIEITSRGR
jgi:hypothetical protein